MRHLLIALALCSCGRTELVHYPPVVDAGPPCEPRPLPLTAAQTNVMFVIDRSGSMNFDLDGHPGGTSRWSVLETSLSQVLPAVDRRLAMGLLMYPLPFDACRPPNRVELSPAVGNASALLSFFSLSSPKGGTPTAEAVRIASRELLALPGASASRALVLATDGAPNCNAELPAKTCVCTSPPLTGNNNCDDSTICLDDTRTIDTLRTLDQDAGIPTYVIGLGSEVNQFAGTLDAMAVAGGAPREGTPRYYSAASQAELTDAFTRITAQLTQCTYLAEGLTLNDTFALKVGGQLVTEGAQGWTWLNRDNGELALHGDACTRAGAGADVTVYVDCH